MKKILFSVFLLLTGFVAPSQNALKPGDVALDFTYNDINGVSQQLYNYTDSGYTVILNIVSASCVPCWTAHVSGVFNQLTTHYGPNGTINAGKIKYFLIEANPLTDSASLYGGANSVGNWVLNTNYPIIDTDAIKTKYPINSYPHFYVVCPNRVISYSQEGYYNNMLQESFWTPFIQSCPVKVTGTKATIVSCQNPENICAGSSLPIKTKIQNLGSDPLTSAIIESKSSTGMVIDSFTWTGNLNTYDFADVIIGNHVFINDTTDYKFKINPVTATDTLAASDSLMASTIGYKSTYNKWTLAVKTDQYPGELDWTLYNSSNAVVQHVDYGNKNSGQGGPNAGKMFYYTLSLNANECYKLAINDSAGDGLYGVSGAIDTGFVKLYEDTSNAPIINFGGNFGYGANASIKTGTAVYINEITSDNIHIYPNPTSSVLNINGLEGEATFYMIDVLGQIVKVNKATSVLGRVQLNLSDLNSGSYFLKIVQQDKTLTKTITIAN